MSVDYSKYAPQFEVYINGEIDLNLNLRDSITSIKVNETLQSAASFRFTINDKFDVDKEEFVWFDNPILQPENKISIKMGYANKLFDLLLVGKIGNISTTGFTQTSNPTVTVNGLDDIKNILNEKPNSKDDTNNRELKGTDLIELFEKKYISRNGKKLDVEPIESTKELPSEVTRNSVNTYGDILADQAQRIGWTYFFTRGKVFYGNPRKKKEVAMKFEWGKDLLEFIPKINTTCINNKISVRSSHPTSRDSITAEANAGTEDKIDDDGLTASQIAEKRGIGPRDVEIISNDEPEAKIRVRAFINQQGDNLVTGNCKIIGTPELEVGQMVQINGVGKRFSGKYYVTSVTNRISSSGYLTNFSVRSNVLRGM